MDARAVVVAEDRNGTTVLTRLRSDPPLLLRSTPAALQLVGGAAGPIGGDRLRLDVSVGAGASLTVRSVAASVVLPGRPVAVGTGAARGSVGPGAARRSACDVGAAASSLSIEVDLGARACLDWAPEPLVSVVGSRHVQRTVVRMAADARLRWREVLVLGRTGEPPGTLTSSLRVERDGHVLTHQEIRFGDDADAWWGPAVLAGARIVETELVVGPAALADPGATSAEMAPTLHGGRAIAAGVLRVADDAVLHTTLLA